MRLILLAPAIVAGAFSFAPAIAAERVVASFYGDESGTRTASGERFDERLHTCAHRSIAFGTWLRVTYKGRAVECCVNDRGPFIKGRGLDLSRGAALAIGLAPVDGVGEVAIETLRKGRTCRKS